LTRYPSKAIAQFVESKLEQWMGLELNRDKTRVVDLKQTGASLDFLGYTFPDTIATGMVEGNVI
jgi:RNA-directed DNA polymerase